MRKVRSIPYIVAVLILLVSFQNCKKTTLEDEVALNNCIDVHKDGYEIVVYQDVEDKSIHRFSLIKKPYLNARGVASQPVFNWYFDDALVAESSDSLEKKIKDCNSHWVRVELESCGQPVGIGKEIKLSNCQ